MGPNAVCPTPFPKCLCLRNIATGETIDAIAVFSIGTDQTTLVRYDNISDLTTPINPAEWEPCPDAVELKCTRDEVCLQSGVAGSEQIFSAFAVKYRDPTTDVVVREYYEAYDANGDLQVITGTIVRCPCDEDLRWVYPLGVGTPAPEDEVFTSSSEVEAALGDPPFSGRTNCDASPSSVVASWTTDDDTLVWPIDNWFAVRTDEVGVFESTTVTVTDETGTEVFSDVNQSSFQLTAVGSYQVVVTYVSAGQSCDGQILLDTTIRIIP